MLDIDFRETDKQYGSDGAVYKLFRRGNRISVEMVANVNDNEEWAEFDGEEIIRLAEVIKSAQKKDAESLMEL